MADVFREVTPRNVKQEVIDQIIEDSKKVTTGEKYNLEENTIAQWQAQMQKDRWLKLTMLEGDQLFLHIWQLRLRVHNLGIDLALEHSRWQDAADKNQRFWDELQTLRTGFWGHIRLAFKSLLP